MDIMDQKPLLIKLPSIALQPYVKMFWFGLDDSQKQFYVIPDGCIDIVIQIGPGSQQFLGVYGSSTAFQIIDVVPGCRYIGIRFQPGQARHFVPIPACYLTNNYSDEYYPFLSALSCLIELEQPVAIFSALEQTCEQWLSKVQPSSLYLDSLMGKLSTDFTTPLAKFCFNAGISERNLQRQFKEYVGISPKLYLRIIRAQQVRNALQQTMFKQTPLAQLALAAGYSDQSHMQREVKLFFGETPLNIKNKK